jgi:hypothetical protein
MSRRELLAGVPAREGLKGLESAVTAPVGPCSRPELL